MFKATAGFLSAAGLAVANGAQCLRIPLQLLRSASASALPKTRLGLGARGLLRI